MRDSSGPALVLSGNRDGGNTLYQNGSGYYWSSTVDSSIGKPFYFALNAEVVYPALSFGKYSGYSVRCVVCYPSSAAMRDSSGPALVLSGNHYGNSTYSQGSNGYYWSSTAYGNTHCYNLALSFPDSTVYPAANPNKLDGDTIRCVA